MALIDVSSIIQLAYFGSFIVLMFYGQRIQIIMMLVGVKRNPGKLEMLRKAAHDSVRRSALRFKGDQKAVESRIDRLTGSFAIQPVIFFFQAEDGIRDYKVTGVQTCALP